MGWRFSGARRREDGSQGGFSLAGHGQGVRLPRNADAAPDRAGHGGHLGATVPGYSGETLIFVSYEPK